MEKKRRIVWPIVLAALTLFLAWMLWPRSLADAFDAAEQMSAVVLRSGVENGKPWTDSETYDLEAGSAQGAAIQTVLEGYSYHLCLDTLVGANGIEGLGDLGVLLNSAGEGRIHIYTESGKFFLDGRVVRVGYWGGAKATALCEELAAVLQAE